MRGSRRSSYMAEVLRRVVHREASPCHREVWVEGVLVGGHRWSARMHGVVHGKAIDEGNVVPYSCIVQHLVTRRDPDVRYQYHGYNLSRATMLADGNDGKTEGAEVHVSGDDRSRSSSVATRSRPP